MIQENIYQLVEFVSKIFSALSGLLVVAIGVYGICQWKKEARWKTKYILAQKIALLVLEFQEKYHLTRSVVTFSWEFSERKKEEGETDEQAGVLNEQYAKVRRLESLQSVAKKLHEATWEANILLDKKFTLLVKPLTDSYTKLFVSCQLHFSDQIIKAKQARFKMPRNNSQQSNSSIVYGANNDEFGKKVDETVDQVLRKLSTYLK